MNALEKVSPSFRIVASGCVRRGRPSPRDHLPVVHQLLLQRERHGQLHLCLVAVQETHKEVMGLAQRPRLRPFLFRCEELLASRHRCPGWGWPFSACAPPPSPLSPCAPPHASLRSAPSAACGSPPCTAMDNVEHARELQPNDEAQLPPSLTLSRSFPSTHLSHFAFQPT
jgi:hypothetical protein